ncbi:hypothetical protein HZ99_13980 [Pseudomonas fluorescens]|nr:hypothetical protein HZ99_13980 [Pseudomonas fluorescens]
MRTLIFIAILVALIGFSGISRPLKIGFVLCMGLLMYYIFLYGGKADRCTRGGARGIRKKS